MRRYVKVDENGIVTAQIVSGAPVSAEFIEVTKDFDVSAVYRSGNSWLQLPAKPSVWHSWNGVSWELNGDAITREATRLLRESDHTMLPDSSVTGDWSSYRKKLRAIRENPSTFKGWPNVVE